MATSKLSPFVYWGQSTETLSLKVDLRIVENVEVTLTEESLTFSAEGQGVKGLNTYSFHLDFYLPVNPEKSRYRKTDLAVEFQIEKSAGETWPRLTLERVKLPWLKIDFDKFPMDDSADEDESDVDNPRNSKDGLLNKIVEEIGTKTTTRSPSMTQNYLFIYNLFQFVGYGYIFVLLLYTFIRDGSSAKQAAFELTGSQMLVCQIAAVLEIIHPLLGLVKTKVLMSLLQVVGRNVILFLLILQEPRLQISPMCWYLFVIWSAIEVVRYPFYLVQTLNFEIKYLTWLRYSLWIPLYPLGILTEATIVFQSITYFTETGFLSISLPNSANIAFYLPYFLVAHLIFLCFGGTNNMKYMYLQRQKQLSSKIKTSSKYKKS